MRIIHTYDPLWALRQRPKAFVRIGASFMDVAGAVEPIYGVAWEGHT